MKSVIIKKNKHFLFAVLVLIILVEIVPIALGVYATDVDGNIKKAWIFLILILQVALVLIFIYLLMVHFGKKVVLLNIVVILLIFYSFEYFLKKSDPFLELPFDSGYYTIHKYKYENVVKPPDDSNTYVYTWGNKVIKNRYGFREREFLVPKPPNTFRVMVIGDSFTYGAGLPEEQRYTNRLETLLKEKFAHRDIEIEVLNFGLEGAPTTQERDVLVKFKGIVSPDLIVIGFCINDPQTLREDYSYENEQYEHKFDLYKRIIQKKMSFVKLNYIGDILVRLIDKAGKYIYGVPPWYQALGRVYDKSSPQWQEFTQALSDIKAISDSMNLSKPILAAFNQRTYIRFDTDLDNPPQRLRIVLGWFEQVRQTAAELGFDVINYEPEIFSKLKSGELKVEDLGICELDSHPSRHLNEIYAKKLFEKIARIFEKRAEIRGKR